MLPQSKDLQLKLTSILCECDSPPESFLYKVLITKDICELYKLCASYMMNPKVADQVQEVLKARTAIFNCTDMSIHFTLRQFVLIAPFLSSWYRIRSGKYKLKTDVQVLPLQCRWRSTNTAHHLIEDPDHESSQDPSLLPCTRSIRLIFDSKASGVTLDMVGKHSHTESDIIKTIPSAYVKHFLDSTISTRFELSSRDVLTEMKHIIGDKNTIQGIGLDNVSPLWVRNNYKGYHGNHSEPTVRDNDEAVKLATELLSGSTGVDGELLYYTRMFHIGLVPCFIVASQLFFKEMVLDAKLLLMDSTHGITSESFGKLITLAYRDSYGNTQAGAVCYYCSNECSADIKLFLHNVFVMAEDNLGITTREAFSKLRYVIIDESTAERAALNSEFNCDGRANEISIYTCQFHKLMNFKRNLLSYCDGLLYSFMAAAMYSTSEATCRDLIHQAITMADGECPSNVSAYLYGQLALIDQWAAFPRKTRLLMQMRTTQRIESLHSIWKRKEHSHYHIGSDDTANTLARKLDAYFSEQTAIRFSITHEAPSTAFMKANLAPLDRLDYGLRRFVRGQYLEAKRELKTSSGSQRQISIPLSISGQHCCCGSTNWCCHFFQAYLLPCKHMFMTALQRPNPSTFIDCNLFVSFFREYGFRTYDMMADDILYELPVPLLGDSNPQTSAQGSQEELQSTASLNASASSSNGHNILQQPSYTTTYKDFFTQTSILIRRIQTAMLEIGRIKRIVPQQSIQALLNTRGQLEAITCQYEHIVWLSRR